MSPVGRKFFSPGEKILLRANNLAGDAKAEISYDGEKSYEYIGQVKSFYSTFLRLLKGAKTTREARIRLNEAERHVLVNRHPFTIAGQPQKLQYTADFCDLSSWKLTWEEVAGGAEYAVLKGNMATGEWTEVAAEGALEYLIPQA